MAVTAAATAAEGWEEEGLVEGDSAVVVMAAADSVAVGAMAEGV